MIGNVFLFMQGSFLLVLLVTPQLGALVWWRWSGWLAGEGRGTERGVRAAGSAQTPHFWVWGETPAVYRGQWECALR